MVYLLRTKVINSYTALKIQYFPYTRFMKSINEKIQDRIYEGYNKYNQKAGIRGMELVPVIYNGEPSIMIGGPVHYNEEKIVKQTTLAASAIGLSAPLLSDYLEEFEMIPEDGERYVLVYSLVQGKHPEMAWVPISEGTIDYDF